MHPAHADNNVDQNQPVSRCRTRCTLPYVPAPRSPRIDHVFCGLSRWSIFSLDAAPPIAVKHAQEEIGTFIAYDFIFAEQSVAIPQLGTARPSSINAHDRKHNMQR